MSSISPRSSLLILSLLSLGLGSCRKGEDAVLKGLFSSAPPKPDVLLFTLDTLRADALGCYGSQQGATPTLDRLASEGVRFDRAFTVTPLTIPAHSSLFTGLLPPRHGVQDNGDFFLDESAITLAEKMKEAGYTTMASVGAEVTSHHWGFSQGFDAFFDKMQVQGTESQNRWRVERRADSVVNDALSWLGAHTSSQGPYFAWVHMFDVHHPYEAPEPHAQRFVRRPYMGEVSYVDSEVNRLLESLDTQKKLDNTWIFVMGDHGESLGAHGESMHGVLLYNETTHIPLIVRPPKGSGVRGKVISAPVSLADVMPTILSIAGLDPLPAQDGLNLHPILEGKDSEAVIPKDRGVYIESLYAYRHYGWAPQTALATADYKLIDSTTPEMYVWSDKSEATNLATTDASRSAELRGKLREWKGTLEPVSDIKGKVEISADRISQLEALGYITDVAESGEPTDGLPDPVSHLPVLREVEGARQALQSGDLDTALKRIEAVIEKEPTLVDPRTMRIQILMRQGRREEALTQAELLAAKHPSSNLKSLMGVLRMDKGDLEMATQLLAEAIDMDPYLAQTWPPFLHSIYMQGDLGRLEQEVERGRKLLPDSAVIQGMEGVILVLKRDFDTAEPVLKSAMAREPNAPLLNMGLADIARARGNDNLAESHYLEELRLYPRAVQPRRALVEIYASQKRFLEQVEQLELVVQREPPNALTYHSLAQALFNLKRFPEALEKVDRCVLLSPKYPACAMLRANTLKKLGREKEALEAYHKALKLGEEFKDLRESLPNGPSKLGKRGPAPAPQRAGGTTP